MERRSKGSKQKIWKTWLRRLVLALTLILLLLCNGLVQLAMIRHGEPTVPATAAGGERVTVQSEDNLQLVGQYWAAGKRQHKWVLLVHGYQSSKELMLAAMGQRYQQRGYHVLAIDQRAHGESEGQFTGMGWLERRDLLRWIQWICAQDEQARIALHGISMGGATVMMTAGEGDLPANVRAVVEDCGYTSAWDIFAYQLELRFHLPAMPVLYVCEGIAQLRTGVNLHQASALEQVKKTAVPMLLIHGTADTFVPTAMVHTLYEAAGGEKELLLVEGGVHALSRQADPELYYDTVFQFLRKYV